MAVTTESVADLCRAARDASRTLATLDSHTKNAGLLAIAGALEARLPDILEANARDMDAGPENVEIVDYH
jgi:glutamate-5-semialdehyde dehydrogenase